MAHSLNTCSLSSSCNKEDAILDAESSYNLSPERKSSEVAISVLEEIQAFSLEEIQALKRKRTVEETRQPEKRQCVTTSDRSEKEEIEGEGISGESPYNEEVFPEVLNDIRNTSQQVLSESSCVPEIVQNQAEVARNYMDSASTEAISPNMPEDPIKNSEETRCLIKNLALENPLLGPQATQKELAKKDIKITIGTIRSIWKCYGLQSTHKRVEALRVHHEKHPEYLLNDIQREALEKKVSASEETRQLIENLALENPLLDSKSTRKELEKKGIKISSIEIEDIWNSCNLGTKEKRIEALKAYQDKHPEYILNDVQKEALRKVNSIRKEALKKIKDPEQQKQIIEKLALENPLLSAESAQEELEKRYIKIGVSKIREIWKRSGLSTQDRRIEALGAYQDKHPENILTDIQKEALKKVRDEEEKTQIIKNLALENPLLGAELTRKELEKKGIKISSIEIEDIWNSCNLGTKEKRIEALKAYQDKHPEYTLNDVQKEAMGKVNNIRKEALKKIKDPEQQKQIIEKLALENPLLSAESAQEELEKKDIKIYAYKIREIWKRSGLITQNQRIEALRVYQDKHPENILTDTQKEALKKVNYSEEEKRIIEKLALENPFLDSKSTRKELQKKGIEISTPKIAYILKSCGLGTEEKRIKALRAYQDKHPENILTDIQKEALGIRKDSENTNQRIIETMDIQNLLNFMPDGSDYNMGPNLGVPSMETESQRASTSSLVAESRKPEPFRGDGSNVQPILLHSVIESSRQNSPIPSIKGKEPLNESLSDRE